MAAGPREERSGSSSGGGAGCTGSRQSALLIRETSGMENLPLVEEVCKTFF